MLDNTSWVAPGINVGNCERLIAFLQEETKNGKFRFDMGKSFAWTDCGTAGCIAGACTALTIRRKFSDWTPEAENAAEFIGVEVGPEYFGHPLFDPDLAPAGCTPAQAIEAIRRVMRGEWPWSEEALEKHREHCQMRGIRSRY